VRKPPVLITSRLHWSWNDVRRAAASTLILAGLTVRASAIEAATPSAHAAATQAAAPGGYDPAKLTDPMSLLVTTPDVWSVSRTDAGCYLISPRRRDSSSLAIGRHPELGIGLFIVNFALSVPNANTGEPVVIQAEGGNLDKVGRIVGVRLLFVPLDGADIAGSLRTLKDDGLLGLVVRQTWIAHGGQKVAQAVVRYGEDCAVAGAASSK
jgi:hypothetical protein